MERDAVEGSTKRFRCQKSEKDVPLSEPRCLNPKAYCQWRTACPIHLLEKEEARARRAAG
ncbi:MAG: hypothetical protein D6708_05765 [Candidatus Dadabacteria bacterium]|nr:MAG: hypothetical protein D6708_05765 [Candidatus Dadabacteria bacterium]